jgi:hypothetical protein
MPLVVLRDGVLGDIEQQQDCGFAEQGHFGWVLGRMTMASKFRNGVPVS